MTDRRMWRWLVFSDLHILFVAAGWTLGSAALVGFQVPWEYVTLSSVGAFLIYRLDHLVMESPEDILNAPERVAFREQNRSVLMGLAVFLVACVLALVVFFPNPWLWIALLVGLIGILYPFRVLPGARRPKDIAWLKTAMIVVCWIGGGVVLPAVLFGSFWTTGMTGSTGVTGLADATTLVDAGALVVFAVQRAVYILPNLIVADWLDRAGDENLSGGNLTLTWSDTQARKAITTCWIAAAILSCTMWYMGGIAPGLLILDGVGYTSLALMGTALIRKRGQSPIQESNVAGESRNDAAGMVWLDMWVGFPVVVWMAWRLMH